MDLVIRAPGIPRPGETVLGSDFGRFGGGKGANQALAAARLGCDVELLGQVGADSFGNELLAGLSAEGVGTAGVRRLPDRLTGVAFIVVAESGENAIVVAPGRTWRGVTPRLVTRRSAWRPAGCWSRIWRRLRRSWRGSAVPPSGPGPR